MKLYFSPGACSLSPHIALHEAGIAHEAVPVALKAHQLADGTDYYGINPLGYVPMLELDDGTRLHEAGVIVQYIADQAPAKNLIPAPGTLARYRVQEWLNFVATELHKGFGPLFNASNPEDVKNAARTKLKSRFGWVDSQLEGRDYLTGEHFSVADGYLFVMGTWAQRMGLDLAGLAHLQAHQKRVGERPGVKAALQMEQDLQKK